MNYDTRVIWFTNNNKKIYSTCLIPLGRSESYPTILMAHGFGGSHKENIDNARRYAQAGYAVCCFDFCGGGVTSLSEGNTTDMSVLTEVHDMLVVFDQIKEYDFVKKDSIILMGKSQGGLVAALCAAKLKEQIKAAILLYPAFVIRDDARKRFDSFDSISTSNLWGVPLGAAYYKDVWNLDAYAIISKYTGPVILFHGNADDIVPVSYSRKASELYDDVRYEEFNGEGHGFSPATVLKTDQMILNYLNEII